MTDKELLEYAAKAAGIKIERDDDAVFFYNEFNDVWCPLVDDGDALRLAVKLSLLCDHDVQYAPVNVWEGQDPYAATRREIVRAAAEIGSRMP